MDAYLGAVSPRSQLVMSSGISLSPTEQSRRASLISEAAVERGRVNNAMTKLKQVEDERSKLELDHENELARVRRECMLELERKELKLEEMEMLVKAVEKSKGDVEVDLKTSQLYEQRTKDKLTKAEADNVDLVRALGGRGEEAPPLKSHDGIIMMGDDMNLLLSFL